MEKISGISIVIPTHSGHKKFLKNLLISLHTAGNNLTKRGYKYEIILVDTSYDKQIRDICKDMNVTYLKGKKSLTKTRNIGIQKSKYAIVLFVDSDCMVDSKLFVEHIKIYEKQNEKKLGGVLGLTIFDGEKKFAFKIMERTSFVLPFKFAEITEHAPWGTCTNISFKKRVLEEIRGFSENWPLKHGGEDVDLGWRVNDAGYYILTNSKAIVHHTTETWSSFIKNMARVWNWGRADYYLFKKYPSRRCLDIVKYPLLWIFILLFAGILASMFNRIILLGIFPTLVLINLFIHGLLISKIDKNYRIIGIALSEFLYSIFELGFIVEGLRNLDPKPLYRKILHSPNQLIYGWTATAIKAWVGVIMLILLIFIVLIMEVIL